MRWQSLAINHNAIFVPIQSYSNQNHLKKKTKYLIDSIIVTLIKNIFLRGVNNAENFHISSEQK